MNLIFPTLTGISLFATTAYALWERDLFLAFTAFNGCVGWALFTKQESES